MKKVFALLTALIIALIPITAFAAADVPLDLKVTNPDGATIYTEPDLNSEKSPYKVPAGTVCTCLRFVYSTAGDGSKDYGWANCIYFDESGESFTGWAIAEAFGSGDKNLIDVELEIDDFNKRVDEAREEGYNTPDKVSSVEALFIPYEEYKLNIEVDIIDTIKMNANSYFEKHTDKTDKTYYEDYIVVSKDGVNIYSYPNIANLKETPKILGTIPYETVFQVINWDEALPNGEEYIGEYRFSYYSQELGDWEKVTPIYKLWYYVDYNGIRGWVPNSSLDNPTDEEIENHWANWEEFGLSDETLVASLDFYNNAKDMEKAEKAEARNKVLIPCVIGAVIIALAVVIIVLKKKKAKKTGTVPTTDVEDRIE